MSDAYNQPAVRLTSLVTVFQFRDVAATPSTFSIAALVSLAWAAPWQAAY